MRTFAAVFVLLGSLGLAGYSAHAAPGAFEGEVVVKFTKPFPVTISYLIKGKKMFSAVQGTTKPMTMVDLEKLEVYHFVLADTYKVVKLPPRDTRPPVRVPVKSGKTK